MCVCMMYVTLSGYQLLLKKIALSVLLHRVVSDIATFSPIL